MQKFKTLQDVIALAEFAHRNQTDKAGEPYFNHPKRVMRTVQDQGGQPYVQMAAVLHDVTEDTAFTSEMLVQLGVPEAAVEIVGLLDRDASELWYEQLRSNHQIACTKDEFYYLNIRKNPGALMVKLADISDNTQPWRLSYLPVDTQERLKVKYAKARQLLGA